VGEGLGPGASCRAGLLRPVSLTQMIRARFGGTLATMEKTTRRSIVQDCWAARCREDRHELSKSKYSFMCNDFGRD
jgi:hypothetical protein